MSKKSKVNRSFHEAGSACAVTKGSMRCTPPAELYSLLRSARGDSDDDCSFHHRILGKDREQNAVAVLYQLLQSVTHPGAASWWSSHPAQHRGAEMPTASSLRAHCSRPRLPQVLLRCTDYPDTLLSPSLPCNHLSLC